MISIIYADSNLSVYFFQILKEIRKHYLSSSDQYSHPRLRFKVGMYYERLHSCFSLYEVFKGLNLVTLMSKCRILNFSQNLLRK